jgi:hypothetical protein
MVSEEEKMFPFHMKRDQKHHNSTVTKNRSKLPSWSFPTSRSLITAEYY